MEGACSRGSLSECWGTPCFSSNVPITLGLWDRHLQCKRLKSHGFQTYDESNHREFVDIDRQPFGRIEWRRIEEETSCYLTGRGLFSPSIRLSKSTTKTRIQQWIL